MYYIKFIMKNNLFKLIEYLYYFSLLVLFILIFISRKSYWIFCLWNDLGQQPNFVNNPIGTSINHLFFFIYLSILSFIVDLEIKNL